MAFDVIGTGVLALAFTNLVFLWWIGDYEDKTKLIMTVVYLTTWVLVFVGFWAVTLAQIPFALIAGAMAFHRD